MDEKKVRSIVFGCLFLANGTTFLCAGCVPVVFALATSVHAFRLDTPDERLDNHPLTMCTCALGRLAGLAPNDTIGRTTSFSGRSGVKPTASLALAYPCAIERHARHPFDFTEEDFKTKLRRFTRILGLFCGGAGPCRYFPSADAPAHCRIACQDLWN